MSPKHLSRSPCKLYRCTFCGTVRPAWLPVAKRLNGAMFLHHLGAVHPAQVGPYLERVRTESIATVATEAYEEVEENETRWGPVYSCKRASQSDNMLQLTATVAPSTENWPFRLYVDLCAFSNITRHRLYSVTLPWKTLVAPGGWMKLAKKFRNLRYRVRLPLVIRSSSKPRAEDIRKEGYTISWIRRPSECSASASKMLTRRHICLLITSFSVEIRLPIKGRGKILTWLQLRNGSRQLTVFFTGCGACGRKETL